MSNNKKAPAIRFKGFNDDWEERKLNTFSEYQSSKYSANQFADLQATGSYPVFDANNQITCLDKYDQESGYISIIKDGAGVGRVALRPGRSSIIGTMGYILSKESDLHFLFNVVQKIDFNKYISGSTIPHVYYRDYGNMDFFVPTIKEQTQIGKFFSNLDSLITLQKRKCDKLILLKKSMLDKMFPKGKKSIPEIRFKGFNDDWEERKLGELGSVAMNKRIFKDQTSEVGDVPFYKIGTFGGEPDAYIPRELFEEYKVKYPYPEVGDILISASGSIGRTVEYIGEDEYFQDSNIVWLKHDGRLNNSFLKQFYMMVEWEGLEGSTIKRLYNKNILETQILLPSLAEQEKIGTFFRTLDNLTTLQKRKLEKLKIIKKSMLDKMFI